MAKVITVNVDDQTGNFSVDLSGFQGKGCADVAKALASIGNVTKDIKKPEWHANNTNLQRK